MLGLKRLLDQVVLLGPYLDRRRGGGRGGGRLFQAVQHLPDVELLHLYAAQLRFEITGKKGKMSAAHFLSHEQSHTDTRTRALCLSWSPPWASHLRASPLAQCPCWENSGAHRTGRLSMGGINVEAGVKFTRIRARCVSSLHQHCVSASLPAPLGLCAPRLLSQGGNAAQRWRSRCSCACLKEWRFQLKKSCQLSGPCPPFLSFSSTSSNNAPSPPPHIASTLWGFAPLHLVMQGWYSFVSFLHGERQANKPLLLHHFFHCTQALSACMEDYLY